MNGKDYVNILRLDAAQKALAQAKLLNDQNTIVKCQKAVDKYRGKLDVEKILKELDGLHGVVR